MQIEGVLATLLLFLGHTTFAQNHQLDLDLSWELSSADTNIKVPAQIPGCVHLDLLENGIISDPFYGANEKELQWISEKSWTYSSTPFSIPAEILAATDIEMNFECLDTYAHVWLNEKLILEADNYFKPWSVPIKSILLETGNILRIEFDSPLSRGRQLQDELNYELPGEPIRAVSRKPQFHYGWDWGPKLTTSGIQGKVGIRYSSNAYIDHYWIKQTASQDGGTDLICYVEVHAPENFDGQLEVKIGEYSAIQQIVNLSGSKSISLPIKLPPSFPRWWPSGHGEQRLHDLTFRLSDNKNKTTERATIQVGIRSIELINETDSLGTSFMFQVNGQPIFMKGANYIPQDIFQTRVGQKDYEELLQDAKDCGMNMLRVWGGGIYENADFYEICDSLGILIWQDFMFACAMYPGNKEFVQNVEEEAQFQVKRLSKYACIALWCGNNENSEGWHRWGWQNDLGFIEKRKVWSAYKCVFQKTLPNTVHSFSSTPYWESSPSLGRGDPKHQFEGDAHYWGVWHDAEPFENFEVKVPRFMSEFGFQSFPSMLSINSFVQPEDQDLTHENILAHEKHSRGIALINDYMTRDFGRVPDNFEDYVVLSQFVQAEGMLKGINAHRIAQPYCMGTLYWQLNDCWPAASWSSMDNLGVWKPLQWVVKNSYDQEQILFQVDSLGISGHLVSDMPSPIGTRKGEFQLITFSGDTLFQKSIQLQTAAVHSQTCFQLSFDEIDKIDIEQCFAKIELSNSANGENLRASTYLVAPKHLGLQATELTFSQEKRGNEIEIHLAAKSYFPRVWLTSNDTGKFSDNYFPLLPGEERVVYFTANSDDQIEIKVKSLNELLAE